MMGKIMSYDYINYLKNAITSAKSLFFRYFVAGIYLIIQLFRFFDWALGSYILIIMLVGIDSFI